MIRTGQQNDVRVILNYHQRIGPHRAVLEIDDSLLLISVVKVGPRKKVYDR